MPTTPRRNEPHSPALISGLRTTASFIDAFNEFVGALIAWLTLLMVIVTFSVVVLRYGFELGWIAIGGGLPLTQPPNQEGATWLQAHRIGTINP